MDNFKDILNSEEGKNFVKLFVQKMAFNKTLRDNNIQRIKKMFKDKTTFDYLMNKIIIKHDDKYMDKCYKKGVMPHPQNLLYAIFNLVEEESINIEPIDDLTKNFPSIIFDYNDWQFAITHGQGSVCSVYHKKELKYRG